MQPCKFTTGALLSGGLWFGLVTGVAQQTTPPPAAPRPGTVPLTSQTPVSPGADPTAPTAAPRTKADVKSVRKDQKQQEKVAKENSQSAKDQSKAAKAQERALKEKNKSTIHAEKAAQPPPS